VLVETVDRLALGPVDAAPQDHARATFAPKLGPADRELDWSATSTAIVNRCRALSPEPAAATSFRGERLKVLRARAVDVRGEPGRVVEVGRDGFVVATGDGGVRLVDVAPAGRRRMSGADFVNGFRPEPGERLG
jgi:methionyl-tRNA formyltransferase